MAEEKTQAVATEGEKQTGIGSGTWPFPDPRALESVMRHQHERGQDLLLRFLSSIGREDFVTPLECLAGGSIRDRVVHMVDAESFWMSVLTNRVHQPLQPADYADMDAILPAWRAATDLTLNFLHTVDIAWFVREGLFAHPHRPEPLKLVPSLVVLHVLTHAYHHKGQICVAARLLGYTPPDLDFI